MGYIIAAGKHMEKDDKKYHIFEGELVGKKYELEAVDFIIYDKFIRTSNNSECGKELRSNLVSAHRYSFPYFIDKQEYASLCYINNHYTMHYSDDTRIIEIIAVKLLADMCQKCYISFMKKISAI